MAAPAEGEPFGSIAAAVRVAQGREATEAVIARLESFVRRGKADDGSGSGGDDLVSLARLLPPIGDRSATAGAVTELVMLAWKLLLRRACNRAVHDDEAGAHRQGGLSRSVLARLRSVLESPPSAAAAREACGVVQNVCFEEENIAVVAGEGALPPLLELIGQTVHAALAAAAAGAVQSIVFRHDGRVVARSTRASAVLCGAIRHGLSAWERALKPLDEAEEASGGAAASAGAAVAGSIRGTASETDTASCALLLVRAAGAAHNLSCDPIEAQSLRECGVVDLLRQLLELPLPRAAASAAGIAQNLARDSRARRELASRPLLLRRLAELLCGGGTEPDAAGAAAAALMNVLAPMRPETGDAGESGNAASAKTRSVTARLIACGLTAGALLPLLEAPDAGQGAMGRSVCGELGSIASLYADCGEFAWRNGDASDCASLAAPAAPATA